MDNLNNIRKKSNHERQLFRTPDYATTTLLNYLPEITDGRAVIDPSAGDGRMMRQIVNRGSFGHHCLCDIEASEAELWKTHGQTAWVQHHIGSYLNFNPGREFGAMLTNPPFTLARDFVQHAKQHVFGPICILQSVAWVGTQKRSEWLSAKSGLKYMLNLARRPRWEFDDGKPGASNIWDFAWYVFERDFTGQPTIDWLFDA